MENQNLNSKQEKTPVNYKKIIISILIVFIITAVVFIIFFSFNDFNETIELLKTVNGSHMGMAVLCLLIHALRHNGILSPCRHDTECCGKRKIYP